MSVSSTSAAAQVEWAPTEVEKAERRVAALEAEKKGLQAKKKRLQAEIITTKAGLRTELEKTKSAEEAFNAVQYGVVYDNESPLATAMRATLVELKEGLKSVNTQLETAGADLATVRKQALEGEKVTLESLGLTKDQVLKSAEYDFAECQFKYQSDDWGDKEKLKTCVEPCVDGKTDKQSRSMLVVATGMGDGKSRFLQEVVGLAEETVKARAEQNATSKKKEKEKEKNEEEEEEKKFDIVELRVNFENCTELCSVDVLPGKNMSDDEKKNAMEKLIVDRLLFRMLPSAGEDYPVFVGKGRRWGFTLGELVSHIQAMFTTEERQAMVFLLVDGIHNLDRNGPDINSDYWANSVQRELIILLSNIITSAKYRFVACTSTVSLPVAKAMEDSTTVNKTMVTPPVLTELPTEIKNKVIRERKKQFIEMFGAHPRSMEVLIGNDEETIEDIFTAAKDELKKRYRREKRFFTAEELRDLLRYSLSAEPRDTDPVGNRHLEAFVKGGLLRMLDGRLVISPLLLMMERDFGKTDANHLLRGWEPFMHGTSAHFEQYVAWVRCLRSRVFEGNVALGDLHHGVAWVSPEPNITIVSTPLVLRDAAHQVETAREREARPISERSLKDAKKSGAWKVALKMTDAEELLTGASRPIVDPLEFGACIVNAKSASAGDAFLSVKTPAGARFNEVIQAKAWEQEKRVLGKIPRLSDTEVLKNAKISASRGDVYLLVTRKVITDADLERLKKEMTGVHVGVVHSENFNEYFGPFASTFLHQENSSPPTKNVLRSWAPARWNPVRAPAVQQAWLPRQLPLGVTPRGTVNALLLRRARCAAKLFA